MTQYRSFRLPVEGTVNAAVAAWLGRLLEARVVDAVMAPCATAADNAVVTALVRDAAQLGRVDVVAPVSLGNSARVLSDITRTGPGVRVAAVLRPCDYRAAVELVKLKQVDLGPVVTIGIDCLGTFEPRAYRAAADAAGGGAALTATWCDLLREGKAPALPGVDIRRSCAVCPHPVAATDLRLGLVGVPQGAVVVEASDEYAEAIAAMGLEAAGESPRSALVSRLQQERQARAERELAAYLAGVPDLPALMAELAACQKCLNCRRACPICYCRECVFETPLFDHRSEQYLKWAARKGIIELPTDTLLFHLTRLNHMSFSCVGCGQCESACPVDLPLAYLWRALGAKVAALFDYEPGRSLDETLPLLTFKEDELEPR